MLDPLDETERAQQLLHFGVLLSYLLEHEALGLAPRPLDGYIELIVRSPDPRLAAVLWITVSGVLEGLGARETSSAADARIQSWLKEREPEFRDVFLRESRGVASAVGAALHDEAENRTHRYPDLRTLIEEAPEEDVTDAPLRENEAHLRGLGHGALRAASLCEQATEIDALSPEERAEGLAALVAFFHFVVEKKIWHLAPQPLTSYPILCPLFENPAVRAHAVGCAASITRESGRIQESFDLLLTLEPDLPEILPEQVVTFRLHGANTLRDLRRLDEASDWYAQAEREAEKLDPDTRDALLDDIAHQSHRRSHYTGRSEERPGHGTEYDPNPFLPGSIFNDPERWRRQPWQLLTLAQNARQGNDPITAHEALTHLADVAAPADHDLLASAHQEAAELAHTIGAPGRVIRWHGFLSLCATVLSGNHRELGGRLSRQATHLASLDDHLSAFTLARWAMGADHVPLYTAGIQADIGYVLLRNGTLEVARDRFETSLASVPGDGLVQAQKVMVETLLGLPASEDDEPRRRLSPTGERGAARWHAAAGLLSVPADGLGTWFDLLRYSKGPVTQWAPDLQTMLESFQRLPEGDGRPNVFGNAPVDDVKARVFEALYTRGLLALLDRYWSVPRWAGAAWALAGGGSVEARREVGLDLMVAAPAKERALTLAAEAGPQVTEAERRGVAAHVDRLLALTFLPASAAEAFGDAHAAAAERRWAAEFVAAHGGGLAFRVRHVDDPDGAGARSDEQQNRYWDAFQRLPMRLQLAIAKIGELRQTAAEAGPVRDLRSIENTTLASLAPEDAQAIREVFALRARAEEVLPAHTDRLRDEIGGWFARPGLAALDLVQGAGAAHAIACRSESGRDVTVSDIAVGRAEAQAAVGALRVAPAVPEAAEHLAAALRETVGEAEEVSLRLREPWEQVPVENLPDATGRSLAQDHVVVRRHGRRPRFGLATVPFPDRVEVLGDPMGPQDALGLPGALEEARAVAALFGTAPVLQEQVTWERLRYSARTADLLWLSTHCEPVPELGGAAALRLHDRWVLPSELAALDVNPGLVVVLTICAGGRAVPLGRVSEPPTATAFLRAGADLVISPLRPIHDETWSPLIVDALTHTLDTDPTPATLVRALNAATPTTELSAPWIMHA
ncbi:CHAT domain-containing protein [Actinomadura decatromicini]|uniref:CHAT domain-containing protein n=1 Tax=Actinomadura decatromicini TaxID=2604572 RepID=A0A5D3FYY9_9ACTN|nr:CHAT domain-containing protein [Actinomadura decatromicini]TYK53146.1 CHAT domain-containing protein [Actinomadura decatromicini]